MAISFHQQNVPSPVFKRGDLKKALHQMLEDYGMEAGAISIIFCSDEELLEMNRHFLNHDYYTDIITFDYSEGFILAGDLYISIDRIRENAKTRNLSLKQEIWRVVGHGVLHLVGFKDKTRSDKEKMTAAEDLFLKLMPAG